jgi:hypothetical protein
MVRCWNLDFPISISSIKKNIKMIHVQPTTLLCRFQIIPHIQNESVTLSRAQSMYHGLTSPSVEAWATTDTRVPNEINSFEKAKGISVMGFGTTPAEAFANSIEKLEKRRIKRNFDLIELTNGLFQTNNGSVQYHLAAFLLKKKI